MFYKIKTKLFLVLCFLLCIIVTANCSRDIDPDNVKPNSSEELLIYISQFDLEDEKIIWNGSIDDDFLNDRIEIDLRKTTSYPEFKLEYLGIKEAVSFEYGLGPFPPDYYFKEEYTYLLNNFRQTIIVYLQPQSKERIVELVRILEHLEFVKSVYPCMIAGVDV